MTIALFAIAVALLVSFWMRSARRKRQEWLHALDLLGKWELEMPSNGSPPQRRSLTLSGDLAGGTYVARDGDVVQRGEWRLRGRSLNLEPIEGEGTVNSPATYDLRLFGKGKIGLDGPGRTREVYAKRDSNVVPLRGVRK